MMLRNLDRLARAHGGAVYMLNGNHESLNIAGDFRCDCGTLSLRRKSCNSPPQTVSEDSTSHVLHSLVLCVMLAACCGHLSGLSRAFA